MAMFSWPGDNFTSDCGMDENDLRAIQGTGSAEGGGRFDEKQVLSESDFQASNSMASRALVPLRKVAYPGATGEFENLSESPLADCLLRNLKAKLTKISDFLPKMRSRG